MDSSGNLIVNNLQQLEPQLINRGTLYDSGYLKGELSDPSIEFVVFSGGGIAGTAFAGVIKELEIQNIRKDIKYWIGSSIGAICAALTVLGMSGDDLIEELMTTDILSFVENNGLFKDTKNSIWRKIFDYRYNVYELIYKLGMISGDHFDEWFRYQIQKLNHSPDITFAELYNETGQHLVVTVTSINTYETLYLSRSSYPHMKIADAVHGSIIIPFLFQPIVMEDPLVPEGKRLLMDGGILDNLPLNSCDVISEAGEILAFNRKAIGFKVISDGRWVPDYTEINGILKYSLTFIESLHNRIHVMQSHQPYFWDRIIPIDTHGINTLSFDIDKKSLERMVHSGRECTNKFLQQRRDMINNHGPLPKNLFIPNHRLRYHGIEYISDDLIENSHIYQTNAEKFSTNKIPVVRHCR